MLFTLLLCPITQLVNVTDFPWNDYDYSILKQTEVRCGQLFPDAPCVKMFKKRGEIDYTVLCGK